MLFRVPSYMRKSQRGKISFTFFFPLGVIILVSATTIHAIRLPLFSPSIPEGEGETAARHTPLYPHQNSVTQPPTHRLPWPIAVTVLVAVTVT